MVDFTHKGVIRKDIVRCATKVKCDICGKDCVVDPVNGDEYNRIRYLGIVHAFQVKYDSYYDEKLQDTDYAKIVDCCSRKCVLDLLNNKYHIYYDEKTLLEATNQIEINKIIYYIVEEDKTMDDKNNTRTEVASLIWDIAKISPEHGNAVMDIIGEEAYERIMEEANDAN